MPQMDYSGLSENWLFKKAGNLHWLNIFKKSKLKSRNLINQNGQRIYPTFLLIKSNYSKPLSFVKENDVLKIKCEISQYGNTFFTSNITFFNSKIRLHFEMLTAFVVRNDENKNDFKKEEDAGWSFKVKSQHNSPRLLNLSKKSKRIKKLSFKSLGFKFKKSYERNIKKKVIYEPSPYTDFNGAGLFYFASYPTVSDSIVRTLVNNKKLYNLNEDWSIKTSTLSRTIFYHGNLNLGDKLILKINEIYQIKNKFYIHTILESKSNKKKLSDIFTIKNII